MIPSDDLERYLRSFYPGHVRTDTPERRVHAIETLARAFPDLKTPLEFVFLKSRRRHTEQHADSRTIIIDDGQGELLGLADAMVRGPSLPEDSAFALWLVPFAERFDEQGDSERALVCATNAMAHRELLVAVRDGLPNVPGYSSTRLFLQLHEIAHFAVDARHEFVEPMAQRVREALAGQVEANQALAARLASDEDLTDLDVSFGPGPSPERSLMAQQVRDYIELIRDHRQVIREASCDLVALDGLLKLRVMDGYDAEKRRFTGVTYREIADAMQMGLRTCRLLVAQELMKHTADAIAARDDGSVLQQPFAHLTVRQDILTDIVHDWFSGIVANAEFDTPFAPNDPASHVPPLVLLERGIRALQQNSVERVMNPIEKIEMSLQDPDVYADAVRETMTQHFGLTAPDPRQVVETASRIIKELPI